MAGKKPVRKKVSKKASTKSLSLIAKYWQNYRTMIILATLAVIFIGYWIIAQELPKRAEKRDLIQKHQKLEEIANNIQGFEKNLSQKQSEQYCYNLSGFKFEKVQKGCVVRVKIIYSSIDIDTANTIKNSVSNNLSLDIKKAGEPSSKETNFSTKVDSFENSYFAKILNIEGCNIGFDYFNERSNFSIDLACQVSPAKEEHFSLKK